MWCQDSLARPVMPFTRQLWFFNCRRWVIGHELNTIYWWTRERRSLLRGAISKEAFAVGSPIIRILASGNLNTCSDNEHLCCVVHS